ncbi:predicted protein [Botrytis cinerea T4]|uniref:Uncharacterized protein n=1 Tax=Botryotinia fuckeliana (strain T4) TaxID=999810 RepID=G2Y0T1_BOTF4|nr:predicted protein [Botrytis cinerea T4]
MIRIVYMTKILKRMNYLRNIFLERSSMYRDPESKTLHLWGEMMRSADEYLNDLDQQSQGILPRAMAGIIFGYLRKMPGKAGTNIIEK